jgi:hypothetical protein
LVYVSTYDANLLAVERKRGMRNDQYPGEPLDSWIRQMDGPDAKRKRSRECDSALQLWIFSTGSKKYLRTATQ